MLPKSNQDQIYLWIDAPKSWTTKKMKELNKDLNTFFKNPILASLEVNKKEEKKKKDKNIKKQAKIDTSLD
jgi:hypothetical protein